MRKKIDYLEGSKKIVEKPPVLFIGFSTVKILFVPKIKNTLFDTKIFNI